jgi:hypothetical protein
MQQVDPTTGQAYGTMPVSWVVEARRRLADVADLAVVRVGVCTWHPAGPGAGLHGS